MRLLLATARIFLAAFVLTGCVSLPEIDAGFRRIDRVWQLEYQQTEDEFRYRVVDGDYLAVFGAVRKTFIDIGMPVQSALVDKGLMIAENTAPAPLTLEEWKKVAESEGPRLKQIGGWMFAISDNPTEYVVTVRATLRPVGGKTFVRLDYELEAPQIRAMGVTPSKHAPPLAVQIGSLKFWSALEKNLGAVSMKAPRRRSSSERDV